MQRLLKKIEKEVLNKKTFAWIMLFFVFLMLMPILYISQYNHTSGDCYWFGFKGYVAWLNTHSIFSVIEAGIINAKEFWLNWQGTYTSIFFFTITPGIFGEQYSFIVPFMMIGMTLFSTYCLYYVVFVKIMKCGLYNTIIFFLMTFFMQIEFIYTPASGLYWYNGAVHYVFVQGFVYIAFAFILMYFEHLCNKIDEIRCRIKEMILLFLMSLFGFIAAGANFSSTLLNIELYTIFLFVGLYLFFKKKVKKAIYYLIPYLITLVGFCLNIMAPGNSIRQGNFSKEGPISAIWKSLSYSFMQMVEWVDVFVVLCLLILVPFILKFVIQSSLKFKAAPLVAIISFCLYSSMFAPAFYATSSEPLSRNQNICKMFLFVILVINEVYLLGWIVKRSNFKIVKCIVPATGKRKWCWFIYASILTMVFAASFLRLDFVPKKAKFVSYAAWDVIYTGDGKKYHEEYLTRLYEYKFSTEDVIFVEPYSVTPYPIWIGTESEVSIREDGKLLDLMAKWYGKEAIYETK